MLTIAEVMTPNPTAVSASTPVALAAGVMRDDGIGEVLVLDADGSLYGVVTDRDIAVRVVAEHLDPEETSVAQVCSREVGTIGIDGEVSDAAVLMRERSLRRLPVLHDGEVVGIVSLGDLAIASEPASMLADISRAQPNN